MRDDLMDYRDEALMGDEDPADYYEDLYYDEDREMERLEAEEEREELDDFLETLGLDMDDLRGMDEDERNAVLEDAGLDPDDFDFTE